MKISPSKHMENLQSEQITFTSADKPNLMLSNSAVKLS